MKGIPKSEVTRERYNVRKGNFIVTSKPDNSTFFLYRVDGDRATKIAKSKNPNEFKEICL